MASSLNSAKSDAYLQARLPQNKKETIERGAALLGMTLTNLIVNSAHEKALEAIKNHEVLELSREASEQFAEALSNTAEPSAAFRKGAERYAAMIKR